MRSGPEPLETRENVPDPRQVATWVVRDIESATVEGQGELDAIATMEELTADDLRALVIELARRVVAAEGGL